MILILLLLLQVKHLICDWLYQPPYMYLNKGRYGHWGGVVHSGFHAFATVWILDFATRLDQPTIWLIAFLELLAHYHIDWAKMNINRVMKWGPTTSENFWRLTGVDQFLHQLCYFVMLTYINMVEPT